MTRKEVIELSTAVSQHGAMCSSQGASCSLVTLVTAAAPALSDDLPLPLLLSQVLPVVSGMDRKEAGRRGTSAAVSVGLVLRRLMSGTEP